MKSLSVSAILAALLLTACGEKAEAPAEPAPAPEASAPAATEPAAAAPATPEPGGYVPTPEERVEGITKTQEELDKMYAEARANTPLPVIPGEAPAEAPAAAAPAEAPATEAK
jgi:hypothetical protein